jgi:tetratricopeptide (TPR) repeat protein
MARHFERYQRALDGYKRTLGKDYPSTLDPVSNVDIVFDRQGGHGKALEWYQRALDSHERTLGKDHSSTLSTINTMGLILRSQGKYGKALGLY